MAFRQRSAVVSSALPPSQRGTKKRAIYYRSHVVGAAQRGPKGPLAGALWAIYCVRLCRLCAIYYPGGALSESQRALGVVVGFAENNVGEAHGRLCVVAPIGAKAPQEENNVFLFPAPKGAATPKGVVALLSAKPMTPKGQS